MGPCKIKLNYDNITPTTTIVGGLSSVGPPLLAQHPPEQGSSRHQSQRPGDTLAPGQCDLYLDAPASRSRKHRAGHAQQTMTISSLWPEDGVNELVAK